ncbi:MAG: glycosyltransferase [Lentimicrobium sp.]|nr:glycosyltransferase [Lentimicrobium sp.]
MGFEYAAAFIVSLAISVAYLAVILYITYGWFSVKKRIVREKHPSTTVSIIIPARNEESSIRQCLSGLLNQDFPNQLIEILVVDDHSEDQTQAIAREISQYSAEVKVTVLSLTTAEGKKEAIRLAMKFATGSLILCTDADCRHPETWVEAMVDCFENENPVFISGPVLLKSDGSFFGLFQEIEFISLVASGAGAIGSHSPIMCNGANLGFSAKAYRHLNPDAMKNGQASGDDVFLMLSMKNDFGAARVKFLKNRGAIVLAEAAGNFSSLIRQRLRWVSKSRAYRDTFLIFTAISVFLINVAIVSFAITGIFHPVLLWLSAGLLFLKTMTDLPLLLSFARFAGKQKLTWLIPFAQPLTVLFTTFTAIAGNLVNIEWKGRKVR